MGQTPHIAELWKVLPELESGFLLKAVASPVALACRFAAKFDHENHEFIFTDLRPTNRW